jgi:hypothetical protein
MVGKGACLLFNGDCKMENNTCWDLYRKVNLTTKLLDDVAAGVTSLLVNSSAGFFAGDVVIISGGAAEAEEMRTITGFGSGSIIVGLALDNDHPADSTVTKQAPTPSIRGPVKPLAVAVVDAAGNSTGGNSTGTAANGTTSGSGEGPVQSVMSLVSSFFVRLLHR